MDTQPLTQEAVTESIPDLINKEYTLQGQVLKWRPVKFKLYQSLELIKLDYGKTEQLIIRKYLANDEALIKGFQEAATGYSIDEIIELFTDKDWISDPLKLATFFEGKEWLLDRVLQITVESQADARESYLLQDKVVEKLIKTCLDTTDTQINYEPETLEECREMMDFARELFGDFFFITTSSIAK